MLFSSAGAWRPILKVLLICHVFVAFLKVLVLDKSDPYKCRSLLTTGKWAAPAAKHYNSDQFTQWLPEGCMPHNYRSKDIETCLQCSRLLLVGDSTIRQIFWEMAKKLDKDMAEQLTANASYHQSHVFSKGCNDLEFIWDPYLNSSALNDELLAYAKSKNTASLTGLNSSKAAAILVGGGLWHARYLGDTYLAHFKGRIDEIASFTRDIPRMSFSQLVKPPRLREDGPDVLLFAPVPTPVFDKLSLPRAETLLPDRIASMNQYLWQVSDKRAAEVLWSLQLMTWRQKSAYEENGIHVVENVAAQQANVLLNLRCNSAPDLQHYPFSKTCCNAPASVNVQQIVMGFSALAMATVTLCYGMFQVGTIRLLGVYKAREQYAVRIGRTCTVLGISLIYCFLADRALLFDKVIKTKDQFTFEILAGGALAAGLLSFRRSGADSTSEKDITYPAVIQPFFSRHQTDEWKGWMQAIILVYHYTGMSKTLWVYQMVRVLVASYLFLTGYGHTMYFLETSNFSLRRCAFVLIRLNLLSCLLAFMMRTDYDFYYFPALSSLWFLIVYTTIRIRHSSTITTIALKIAISAIIVTIFTYAPGILEVIFYSLRLTCNIHINVYEFRFRTTLDLYTAYIGMAVGALYFHVRSTPITSSPYLIRHARKHAHHLHALATIASLIILPAYFLLIRCFDNKYAYNRWHPFISFLPILSFITLRNSTQRLRNHHSTLFAWLGRCSLETFILQYHIWLAADTKGLLSLGLWHRSPFQGLVERWTEFAVITIFFLWASFETSLATAAVTKAIVGSDDGHPENGRASRRDPDLTADLDLDKERLSPLPKGYKQPNSSLPNFSSASSGSSGVKTVSPLRGSHSPLKDPLARRLLLILVVMWVANWTYT